MAALLLLVDPADFAANLANVRIVENPSITGNATRLDPPRANDVLHAMEWNSQASGNLANGRNGGDGQAHYVFS
jgi:hypothetical protein